MFKHSIFDLLKTFTKEEKDRLSLFIKSPYFYKGRKLRKLYEEIIKYYPSFDSKELTKENLSREIYPEDSYDDSAMRKTMHVLLNLLLQFLSYERFKQTKYVQEDYLLKELTQREMKKLFVRNENRIESELKKEDKINTEYLYKLHLLEANKFNFNMLNTKVLKKETADEEMKEIEEGGKYLILYFLIELLNEYVELLVIGDKYNIEFKRPFLNKLIGHFNIESFVENLSEDDKHIFILKIYYSMYRAFASFDNEKYYYEYKSLFLKHINKISHEEITENFTNLVIYCSLKNKSSFKKDEFEPELMNLYEIIIKNEYYITDKVKNLPNEIFKNILFMSIIYRDIQWTSNFIKEYSKKLNPKDRKNMSNFGNAYVHHQRKEYERSLNYLNEIKSDSFNYPFDKKNLRLKNYYELEYTEQVFSEIDAYRKMLGKSDMLSNERKTRHRNFLSYLEKIVKHKTGSTKIDIDYIKQKLKAEDQVHFKEWLLGKIEEIESGSVK